MGCNLGQDFPATVFSTFRLFVFSLFLILTRHFSRDLFFFASTSSRVWDEYPIAFPWHGVPWDPGLTGGGELDTPIHSYSFFQISSAAGRVKGEREQVVAIGWNRAETRQGGRSIW
jgi:hypothetical protein